MHANHDPLIFQDDKEGGYGDMLEFFQYQIGKMGRRRVDPCSAAETLMAFLLYVAAAVLLHGLEKIAGLNRPGQKPVHSGFETPSYAVAFLDRGYGYDGNIMPSHRGSEISADPCGFYPVQHGHLNVHRNEVESFFLQLPDRFLSVKTAGKTYYINKTAVQKVIYSDKA